MSDHSTPLDTSAPATPDPVSLDGQLGFHLRRAYQRATANFADAVGDAVTPQQFAVLVRLNDVGAVSQNRLGRLVDMDPATIHGVVRRLAARGLVDIAPDPEDRRRSRLSLNAAGRALMRDLAPPSRQADRKTGACLSDAERATLLGLLRRIADQG